MPAYVAGRGTDMTAAITYRYYTENATRLMEAIADRSQVSREREYYLENIEKVKSVDQFMADDRLYNFALTAYGLGDMAYAKAFIRAVLTEGTDDRTSLANRLTDRRYRDFAEDFNFARYGELTTTFERTRSGTVERYMQATFEVDAGNRSEGSRLALYFDRRSEEIESAYDILADRALFETVRVAYQMPVEMSLLPLEKQADMINSRLDLEKLGDAEYKEEFLERFTLLWDIDNPQTPKAPSILPIGTTVQTMSTDLLTAIQNLKRP